ncbi:MAG: PQQ-like beta-propeller repeat protein, partial [Myxococcales bacterium]|nr:PQQ-like beta-propeller repeat protein [Myxococcales bacterium]
TGKGIFSVPVIGADGSILVGSADRFFYSLDFFGNVNWTAQAGEIIDSAAAVAADGSIVFGAGDGLIRSLSPDGVEQWRFAAHHAEFDADATEGTFCAPVGPIGGPSNWFEGNVVIGPGGNLYAGNDNYRFYGLTPDGAERYAFAPTLIPFGTVWSAATTRLDGSAVFGALDFFLYSIDDQGNCQWRTFMGALVTSSPAQSDDGGTIYAGSWDFNFRAVDAATGAVRWTFPSREHIYSSPAVAEDGTVYFGGVDGTLYALDGDTGALRWTYDVIDPIRSSPAIAGDGTIFFSAGNGVLYAINPDGTRRWSYDATTQDRNDLNSSPALGLEYLYLGGEDGTILAMPYEYCERVADPRCSLDPGSDLGAQGVDLYYVTPGGRSFLDIPDPVQRGAALTFRLAVRNAGRTEDAGL